MNIEQIKSEALREIAQEKFRIEVDAEKQRLKQQKPLWKRVFPWKIIIKRR